MKQLCTTLLFISLLAPLTACATAQDSTPSVDVSDQSLQDGSVTVASVTAEQDGFIVIHRANADGSGPLVPSSIGHSQVGAGANSDVQVTLDESVGEGDTLFAMLHVDSNGNGVYEFGPGSTDVDTPVAVDGNVVVTPFTVQGGATATANGLISRQSAKSVEETQAQLETAIDANEALTIMATIDHAANAEGAGLELRPTRVVIFGNPNLGTPLMQAQQSVAIDLPQKMLIYEDEAGDVFVTYNDPFYLKERHGVEGQDDTLNTIANALNTLAKAATAE